MRKVEQWIVFSLLNAFAYLIWKLGFRGRRRVARTLAWVAFDLLGVRRKVILQNLEIAFGAEKSAEERLRIARESTEHFFLITLEFFASKRLYPSLTLTFPGREVLDGALQKGQGAYMMAVHMGNFELMCATGTMFFAKAHAVTKKVGNNAFLRWVKERRAGNGEFEVEASGNERRQDKIIAALRNNELIGFMVDQRRSKGVVLPFFGRSALTNTSLFYLWKQQPSPIIPVLIHRISDQHHETIIMDEFVVETDPSLTEEEFYLRNARKMNLVAEKIIRMYPEQYFWMHKRWKGVPVQESSHAASHAPA